MPGSTIDFEKYGFSDAKPSTQGPDFSKYGFEDVAPSGPGSESEPLNEQGVTPDERLILATASNPEQAAEWLSRKPGEAGKPTSVPKWYDPGNLLGVLANRPEHNPFSKVPEKTPEPWHVFPTNPIRQYETRPHGSDNLEVRPTGSQERFKLLYPEHAWNEWPGLGEIAQQVGERAMAYGPSMAMPGSSAKAIGLGTGLGSLLNEQIASGYGLQTPDALTQAGNALKEGATSALVGGLIQAPGKIGEALEKSTGTANPLRAPLGAIEKASGRAGQRAWEGKDLGLKNEIEAARIKAEPDIMAANEARQALEESRAKFKSEEEAGGQSSQNTWQEKYLGLKNEIEAAKAKADPSIVVAFEARQALREGRTKFKSETIEKSSIQPEQQIWKERYMGLKKEAEAAGMKAEPAIIAAAEARQAIREGRIKFKGEEEAQAAQRAKRAEVRLRTLNEEMKAAPEAAEAVPEAAARPTVGPVGPSGEEIIAQMPAKHPMETLAEGFVKPKTGLPQEGILNAVYGHTAAFLKENPQIAELKRAVFGKEFLPEHGSYSMANQDLYKRAFIDKFGQAKFNALEKEWGARAAEHLLTSDFVTQMNDKAKDTLKNIIRKGGTEAEAEQSALSELIQAFTKKKRIPDWLAAKEKASETAGLKAWQARLEKQKTMSDIRSRKSELGPRPKMNPTAAPPDWLMAQEKAAESANFKANQDWIEKRKAMNDIRARRNALGPRPGDVPIPDWLAAREKAAEAANLKAGQAEIEKQRAMGDIKSRTSALGPKPELNPAADRIPWWIQEFAKNANAAADVGGWVANKTGIPKMTRAAGDAMKRFELLHPDLVRKAKQAAGYARKGAAVESADFWKR